MGRRTRPEEATQERIAKLPKWAQDYLWRLEKDRDEAVRARDEALTSNPPGRTIIGSKYARVDKRPVFYSGEPAATFDLSPEIGPEPGDQTLECRPRRQADGSWALYIMAHGGRLTVQPSSHNTCEILCPER